MKPLTLIAALLVILMTAALTALGLWRPAPLAAVGRAGVTRTAGFSAILPGRVTETAPIPQPATEETTAEVTAEVGATVPPEACLAAFPFEVVRDIEFGRTTSTQLRAAFGEPVAFGGRAPGLRFERGGCTLIVRLEVDTAQEAELQAYGTLGWVLETFGPPDAAGVAQGNLALPLAGTAVLFYPEAGVTALFDADLADLHSTTPVERLLLREPYALNRQARRFNVELDDWLPPLR